MATAHSPISEYVGRWRQGEAPSAQAVLREHPELAKQKNFVLDLAYEEFCLRTEAGEHLAPSTFCDQFPTYRKSLERLLGVHELLAADRAFAALVGDVHWPSSGDDFLGFHLREELGKGAVGRVFLASEPALGNRLVVLKLALQGGREAEILGKLPHPHIVPIHSVNEDVETGLTAVCMPFLGAATLCDVIDRALAEPGPVSGRVVLEAACDERPRAAPRSSPRSREPLAVSSSYINAILRIGVQLAGALEFAHAKGILHRDLKPSNVLIAPSGAPMLLDFNLSSDEQSSELRVGGTLPYAAPEQLRAILGERGQKSDEVDERSDLYSLGVVLDELLSGRLPFEPPPLESPPLQPPLRDSRPSPSPVEAAARAILARQAAGTTPLRTRCPSIDPATASVVERCLQFDPAKRPESATELVRLLQSCLAPRRRATRWSRLHKALSAGAFLVVIALLVAGAAIIAMRDPYYLRQLHAALRAIAAKDYEDAIQRLNEAAKLHPGDPEILVARGQAFQGQGDFLSAARDYQAAAEHSPAGVIRANAAYCLARANVFGTAIDWNKMALDANYRTAEVYNNLGYSQLKHGQPADARESLSQAIVLNPGIQSPYYNRGLADLVWFNIDKKHSPPKTGLADLEQAIGIGPESPELFFDAACLNAAAAPSANRHRIAVSYLVDALNEGFSQSRAKSDPLLASCRTAPEVEKLLNAAPRPRRLPQPVNLIPPAPPSSAELTGI